MREILSKKKLLELALEIQTLQDMGKDYEEKLNTFADNVSYPYARDLFFSDIGPEYIVNRCINHVEVKLGQLNKQELILLVQKLKNGKGEEWDEDIWLDMICSSVIDPEISNYIYWSSKELTAEEIVEKALEYKPILL